MEIGAGTGAYSLALARKGYDVTAIELSEKNLEVLQQKSIGIKNIIAMQGDALDLSILENNSFDITLLFGPMYHLYEEKDHRQALNEAVRVTKSGGIIMVAFLSIHAIMLNDYLFAIILERGWREILLLIFRSNILWSSFLPDSISTSLKICLRKFRLIG